MFLWYGKNRSNEVDLEFLSGNKKESCFLWETKIKTKAEKEKGKENLEIFLE